MLSPSARVSGHPLLSFKVDIHERLEVVEIERDAVVPGTVQFKEETRGRGRNRRTNGGSAAGVTEYWHERCTLQVLAGRLSPVAT